MPCNGWAQVPVEDDDKQRIYAGNILGVTNHLEKELNNYRKPGRVSVEISKQEEAELQKVTNMYTRLQISIPVSNHERILETTRTVIAI